MKELPTAFRLVCLSAAVLFPMAAYASFGGTPCQTFGCHFGMWTLIGFVWPIPLSSFIFLLLHAYFCNPERSKNRQMILADSPEWPPTRFPRLALRTWRSGRGQPLVAIT